MDFRFRDIHDTHIRSMKSCDRVALAGASKAIVDEDTRSTAIKQIKLANKLHGVDVIYLIDHEDCGAYGGKAAAKSDKDEIMMHKKNAEKARKILISEINDLQVVTKMAMLNGEIINL
jgi:carbonic anhydrase